MDDHRREPWVYDSRLEYMSHKDSRVAIPLLVRDHFDVQDTVLIMDSAGNFRLELFLPEEYPMAPTSLDVSALCSQRCVGFSLVLLPILNSVPDEWSTRPPNLHGSAVDTSPAQLPQPRRSACHRRRETLQGGREGCPARQPGVDPALREIDDTCTIIRTYHLGYTDHLIDSPARCEPPSAPPWLTAFRPHLRIKRPSESIKRIRYIKERAEQLDGQ